MAPADQLLTVREVGRLWGTTPKMVLAWVERERLRCLSRTAVLTQGLLDAPAIRESWAQYALESRPRAENIVVDQAVSSTLSDRATAFWWAVRQKDAQTVWELSTPASRARHGTPAQLLAGWSSAFSYCDMSRGMVASAPYRLSEHDAVVIRVVERPSSSGAIANAAVPVFMMAPLPFVPGGVDGLVDIGLFEAREEWEVEVMDAA